MMIGSKEEMDETNCVQHLKINKKGRRLHLYLLVPFTPPFGSNFYHFQQLLLEGIMMLCQAHAFYCVVGKIIACKYVEL